jgi:integrase/recombinase XerD
MIGQWVVDAKARQMSAKTIKIYLYQLKRFQKYCDSRNIQMANADKLVISDYILTRKVKIQTIEHELNALSNYYNFLIFKDLIEINPVDAVRNHYLKRYKQDGEKETHQLISIEKAAELIRYSPDIREKAILMLLFKTGIRIGELHSLDVSDIDFADQSILLKRTAKRSNRTVFFDPECERYLRRWLAVRKDRNQMGEMALFITSWGHRLGVKSMENHIRAVATAHGVNNPDSDRLEDRFSPHCCRHWHGTYLLRSDMKREYVKWLRGDVMKDAIDIYFHIDPEDVKRQYLLHIPQLGI